MSKLTRKEWIVVSPGILGVVLGMISGFFKDDFEIYVELNFAALGMYFLMVLFVLLYFFEKNKNRIMDCRLEIEELMEDVNALKKSKKSQNP